MKLFKKTLSVLLAALLLGCTALVAFAADGDITVSLRVEGLDKCLFYDDVTVPADSTALDVLKKADASTETLTLNVSESQYGAYLNAINDLFAGSMTTKRWDGWMFRVNDVPSSVGIDAYKVEADDCIVVYYSDEYGDYGMLYPVLDESKLGEGKVSFTSTVTEYDSETGEPTEKEAAVTGYTLIWDGEEVTPDENGVVTLTEAQMTEGEHSVQIERYAENGLPTVLRFAPDYKINIAAPAQEPQEEPQNEPEQQNFFVKILNAIKSFFQKIIDFFKGLFTK